MIRGTEIFHNTNKTLMSTLFSANVETEQSLVVANFIINKHDFRRVLAKPNIQNGQTTKNEGFDCEEKIQLKAVKHYVQTRNVRCSME